jgi:DNA mismatch endonuclease (patch repair protein)
MGQEAGMQGCDVLAAVLRPDFRRSGGSPERALTDVVDAPTRSRMMSGIRGKDTLPEMLVRKALFAAGFRFRLHRADFAWGTRHRSPGEACGRFRPRLLLAHALGLSFREASGDPAGILEAKLEGNVARDRKAIDSLMGLGWRALVVWECATRGKGSLAALPEALAEWIGGVAVSGELSGGSTVA